MATLTIDQIADMVVATQKDLGRLRLTEIATDLQRHVALSQLMKKNRRVFRSGTEIQFNVLLNGDDNTRNVGLFEVDNLNQADGLVQGSAPWRHTTSGYVFDRRQVSMNRSPAKILDIVKEKRYMQLIGLAEKMEENFWGQPASSSDLKTPFGIKYCLVYNATEGFNGGNNSRFSGGPYGIDRNAHSRWKNYTAQYTAVSKTDLIRKMRKAAVMTNFMPVIPNPPIPDYADGHRYGWYTNYDVLGPMEELLEDQNDRLGNDLASKDGQVLFRRTPVTFVPYLQQNDSTSDPVVGIDWGVFKTVVLQGEYLREERPRPAPLQHNVLQAFLDLTYNWVCYDCRRLILIAKSDWAS